MTIRVPDRKRQIVDQATRLFSRNGFDKVTVKDLAQACGITEPALYRHFKSKEAIYDAVLSSLGASLEHQELFDRLADEDRLDVMLNEIAEHILTFFNAHREPYRLLLYSALGQHTKARQVYRSIRLPYVEFLQKRLDHLYAEGLVIKKDNEITAKCFVGMVFDCATCSILWNSFQGRKCAPQELIANNIPIFVSGLSTGRKAKKADQS
ncbi:MAG: TetR/AcrR family transcriptional regulator [bacterium]